MELSLSAADPGRTASLLALAREALDADELDTAAEALERFVALQPRNVTALAALARVHLKRSDLAAHDAALDRAIALAPRSAALRLRAALACPPMMASRAQIQQVRARSLARLEALIHAEDLEPIADPLLDVPTLSFYFVYHGEDDRPLNQRLDAALRRHAPALSATAPHTRAPYVRDPRAPIRLGIFSTYLRDHTIGCLFKELIARLDRRRFHRVLLFSEPDIDAVSVDLAARAGDTVVLLPRRLAEAQQRIAAQKLDLLWYPDIGMDSLTAYLAFARLARVQATTWGHPNSTGIQTMDAFFSLTDLEPDLGGHPPYTEALLCQDAPNTYYVPTYLSERPARAAVGLPAQGNLYGCPQTLFKLHPDFDAVLLGILARDPAAVLVMHEGRTRGWRDRWLARIAAQAPGVDLGRRIHWIGSMPRDQYVRTLAALDVMLDPFPFGGGNTTLEAFAVGTPVVTLPPRFARGRLAYAFYRRMGYTDLVADSAEDYVQRAVALGTEPAARARATRAIVETRGRVLECDDGVHAFEGLLEAAMALA